MKPELEKKLYDKYPQLFGQKDLPMTQTCMCWGIECGDGWYDLLDDMCGKIMEHINSTDEKGIGEISFVQVKEKWGGLRVYVNFADDEIYNIINEAEAKSESTCEACGKPGTLSEEGWITCLCKECREKNN